MTNSSRLKTLEVHRTHHIFRDAKLFRLSIVGEYAGQRIYQDWADPTGEVIWDGERAWSNDWGFAGRFYEAPPIKKPSRFNGRRDQFGLVIEKQSHAGQLDYSSGSADQDHFADVFLSTSQPASSTTV